jgi:hypothetical protein
MNSPGLSASSPPSLAALHSLPADYRVVRRLDLESPRTLLALGVLSVVMLLVGLLSFGLIAALLGPQSAERVDPLDGANPLVLSAALIVMFILMLASHEAFHGLAFRLFGARPHYGLNLSKGVAYAAAPDDYLPRKAYLVVAIAPLVGVTLGCALFMALTGGTTRTVIALTGAANVSGAAGDVWFFAECLRRGRGLLVRDFGEGAELYLPVPVGSLGKSASQIHEDERGDAPAGEDQDQRAAEPEDLAGQPQ